MHPPASDDWVGERLAQDHAQLGLDLLDERLPCHGAEDADPASPAAARGPVTW